MKKHLYVLLLSIIVSSIFSCKKKASEELNSADPFAGIDCDQTVSENMSDTDFTALLSNGTDSNNVFRICIYDGVTISSSGAAINIGSTNIEILGGEQKSASLNALEISGNGSSHIVRLKNLNLQSSTQQNTIIVNGSIRTMIENSIVTNSATGMEPAAVRGSGNSTFEVINSTLTSVNGNSVMTVAQNGVNNSVSISNSILVADGSGLQIIAQNSSGVTVGLSTNVFKTNGNGGIEQPTGIRAIAQNSSNITLNDTSSTTLLLFCTQPGSAANMSQILNSISQNGSNVGGSFNPTNTQNGNNTSIANCL